MEKLRNKYPFNGFILTVILLLAIFTSEVNATEIIVNKSVPDVSYSAIELRAIFTMQKRFWPNNRKIKVYILPDNNPSHKDFVKNKLNMFPHQIRRVWDRITYSGTGAAPIELDSEQRMIEKIATTPDSIGYLTGKPDHENIRSIEYR